MWQQCALSSHPNSNRVLVVLVKTKTSRNKLTVERGSGGNNFWRRVRPYSTPTRAGCNSWLGTYVKGFYAIEWTAKLLHFDVQEYSRAFLLNKGRLVIRPEFGVMSFSWSHFFSFALCCTAVRDTDVDGKPCWHTFFFPPFEIWVWRNTPDINHLEHWNWKLWRFLKKSARAKQCPSAGIRMYESSTWYCWRPRFSMEPRSPAAMGYIHMNAYVPLYMRTCARKMVWRTIPLEHFVARH
jgi:hypothetical protein